MRIRIFCIFVLLSLLVSIPGVAQAQEATPFRQARTLLASLTPEERVGQLFLVTFQGIDTAAGTPINDLIVKYHIGGVVLRADNDNFVAAPDTIASAYQLISGLQKVEWDSTVQPADPNSPHTYIPLLVGLRQEGGGYPNDQILDGLTQIPGQMAFGATWNTNLAQQAGSVMGRELSSLGINFYMGLSLDVLTSPAASVSSDLSTRVFGGDPYWVGEMGRAFIAGMQAGSDGRMAVVASHFPGRGEADRPADQEVSTVRKSLEELKQIELAPFFAASNAAPSTAGVADAMLVSHIRYQGFQGNIRATTRPVSFDQQALGLILGLPQISGWRQAGGVIVSDDLGTQAVRRFYDPGGQNFSARLVARDAFLAGNDLLYMGNIVSSDAENNYASLARTLEFFAQKYREDPAFAQRVDESVLRILALKYRLYPNFTIETVQTRAENLFGLGQSQELAFTVARQAATLISPSSQDLQLVMPEPPVQREYIVFFTDTRTSKQCSSCPEKPIIAVDAFQNSVRRLYGPSTGGLVTPSHLSSYSFNDLLTYIDGRQTTSDLEDSLRRADWVVISTLDLGINRPESQTLRRFLNEKQTFLLNKRIVLFSFSAPYYLDATDISKLTAYYGLYSSSSAFVEMAARLLFQELGPAGSLPVSVPGIGYDLITATSPNPNQVISLSLDLPLVPTPTVVETPGPTPAPIFKVADTISLRTGILLDHNYHQVPDGTVVRFVLTQAESGFSQQIDAVTEKGVARASFRLDQPGLVEIRAVSEPATVSDVIQLPVSSEGAPAIIITPTQLATPTIEPTPTITAATATPAPVSVVVGLSGYPTLAGWVIVMIILLSFSMVIYWIGVQFVGVQWGIRWSLLALLSGLLAYNYLVLDLPASVEWLGGRGLPAFMQAVLLGQAAGWLIGLIWRLAAQRAEQTEQK